jgi:hypothetical protein
MSCRWVSRATRHLAEVTQLACHTSCAMFIYNMKIMAIVCEEFRPPPLRGPRARWDAMPRGHGEGAGPNFAATELCARGNGKETWLQEVPTAEEVLLGSAVRVLPALLALQLGLRGGVIILAAVKCYKVQGFFLSVLLTADRHRCRGAPSAPSSATILPHGITCAGLL